MHGWKPVTEKEPNSHSWRAAVSDNTDKPTARTIKKYLIRGRRLHMKSRTFVRWKETRERGQVKAVKDRQAVAHGVSGLTRKANIIMNEVILKSQFFDEGG